MLSQQFDASGNVLILKRLTPLCLKKSLESNHLLN
jgi:hypothetical protein